MIAPPCSVESLKKQYNLLQTRRMLADYGLKDVNLSNISLAKVRYHGDVCYHGNN